ncbi:Porin domain-containing protein (plasmid) [Cupriavidus sp. H19C3]|uniref:porin n=1 Tax=Cupriavidus sp. H19C3 TaxID=3241603 RepID=UPI003BF8A572
MRKLRSRMATAGALAVLVPSAAWAQSSVTLYGVIDTGVEFVNNVGPQNNSMMRMLTLSGTVPSRWGLRGTEDLGGGLKSAFVLESGFGPDTGTSNQGGRLFGRQAWVGLQSNSWGQVAFGRQYTMLFWATLDTDILGPNVYGSMDSYFANARADNAISYKGKFGGLTLGATYSFGRDATATTLPSPSATNCPGENPADKNACREWSAMLMYETNWLGASVAYDSLRGGPGAFAGLTSSGLKDDRAVLSGYMLLDRTKIGAGVLARRNGALAAPRSNMYFAGVSYDLTPVVNVAAEAYYLDYRHSDNKAWLGAVRGTYAFSKRTSVYVSGGYIDNSGQLNISVSAGAPGANPVAGGNQFGVTAGIKHIF